MITKIVSPIEAAFEDRQFSAAAGLISVVGRWLQLDPAAARRMK